MRYQMPQFNSYGTCTLVMDVVQQDRSGRHVSIATWKQLFDNLEQIIKACAIIRKIGGELRTGTIAENNKFSFIVISRNHRTTIGTCLSTKETDLGICLRTNVLSLRASAAAVAATAGPDFVQVQASAQGQGRMQGQRQGSRERAAPGAGAGTGVPQAPVLQLEPRPSTTGGLGGGRGGIGPGHIAAQALSAGVLNDTTTRPEPNGP